MRAAAIAAVPSSMVFSRARLQSWIPPVVLGLAWASVLNLIPPLGEFPVSDDWVHTWSVQSILERGRPDVSAWAAVSLVLQAYWGALFAHAFGFSHLALRASTLVLSAVGLLGFYVLLREVADPPRALLASLLLLFNPLYLYFQYSFMTEVPFICISAWALVFYVRALRAVEPRAGLLLLGSTLAAAGYLVRQLGLVLPLAALLALSLRSSPRPKQLVALLGPLLPAILLYAYFDGQRGAGKQEPVQWALTYWLRQGPGMVGVILARLTGTFTTLGLFVLPLSIGLLSHRPRYRPGSARFWTGVALLAVLVGGGAVHLFIYGEKRVFPATWSLLSNRGFEVQRFGARSPDAYVVPEWALSLIGAASVLGAVLLVIAVVELFSRENVNRPTGPSLIYGPLALGMTIAFVTFNDRYLLVLLPSALLFAVVAAPPSRWGYCAAVAGVMLTAAWSLAWERDYWGHRSALWEMGLSLGERGILPQEIDGGYEWNGWFRGQAVIGEGARQAQETGWWGSMNAYVNERLHMSLQTDPPRRTPWIVAIASPAEANRSRTIAATPYGPGEWVVAIQRPPD